MKVADISENFFILGFHSVFALIAAAEISRRLMSGQSIDFTIGVLVVGYNIVYGFITQEMRNNNNLFKAWKFCAILSIFMIIPDAFLSQICNSIYFPTESHKFGGVAWYMGGMWTIPSVLILALCPGTGEPSQEEVTITSLVSLIIFGMAE